MRAQYERGELSAETEADARASLRRIGLQVIDIRPVKTRRTIDRRSAMWEPVRDAWNRHKRGRRRMLRAEFYDGLATMLDSGLPLLEAVDTLIGTRTSARWRSFSVSPRRTMLIELHQALHGGDALDEAMAHHPDWFDPTELAMIRAGQHNGDLAGVLRTLADQHQRSGELSQKLLGALTYPMVIAVTGLCVVIFLSVKTLPDLVSILQQADIAIPVLTQRVMTVGQFLFHGWWIVFGAVVILLASLLLMPSVLRRTAVKPSNPNALERTERQNRNWSLMPRVVRRILVGTVSLRLAELVRSGVPVVEALRVLAPTCRNSHLTRALLGAANAVERGDDIASALDDRRWFDIEYQRLLAIGQTTGELDELLERIGNRYHRQAKRLIDRLAALLEPAVLIVLAVLIGIVVMAAILPLIKLQEVLG